MLIEGFGLTEGVESLLHLCDVDIDLLLDEVLDERIVQGILRRKKRGEGLDVFNGYMVMVMVR